MESSFQVKTKNLSIKCMNWLLRHRYWFSIFIVILLVVSWIVVYKTNGTSKVYVHLFYLPIILGAYCFGGVGGVLTGIISGIIIGPFMPMNVDQGIPQPTLNWMIRLSFFAFFGYFVGQMFYYLRLQKKNTEEISTSIISALANSIEARDQYTRGHCNNVMEMSVALAKEMNLTDQEINNIRWSSIIHDVGKIGIPEEILNKPGKLTKEEYEIIKLHPSIGAKIIKPVKNLSEIMPGVKYHHESLDGSGYPEGLRGDQIPLQARIIAIADVWDAITSDRPYRKGMEKDKAIEVLKSMAGLKLDEELVNIFIEKVLGLNEKSEGEVQG